MSYQSYRVVGFGLSKAGLATVGYQLFDSAGAASGSRITAGVQDLADGQYGALVTLPDGFRGRITWDTGEGTPVHASEEINPQEQENADLKTSTRAVAGSTSSSVAATTPGSTQTIIRGDTAVITLTGIGSLIGRTKLWFTVKDNLSEPDTDAVIQVEETAGLVRLNGAAGTASQASITVTDATNGDLTVTIDEVATASLGPFGNYKYDVQALIGSTVVTRTSGTFKVLADVTRATS